MILGGQAPDAESRLTGQGGHSQGQVRGPGRRRITGGLHGGGGQGAGHEGRWDYQSQLLPLPCLSLRTVLCSCDCFLFWIETGPVRGKGGIGM